MLLQTPSYQALRHLSPHRFDSLGAGVGGDGPSRADMVGYKVISTLNILVSTFESLTHQQKGAAARAWLSSWGTDDSKVQHLASVLELLRACQASQGALQQAAQMLAQGRLAAASPCHVPHLFMSLPL